MKLARDFLRLPEESEHEAQPESIRTAMLKVLLCIVVGAIVGVALLMAANLLPQMYLTTKWR